MTWLSLSAHFDRNESHVIYGTGHKVEYELRYSYTRSPGEQLEKELETGNHRRKIRVSFFRAGVAQLVEHFLAKEDVARSNRVTRFRPLVPRGLQRGRPRFRQVSR